MTAALIVRGLQEEKGTKKGIRVDAHRAKKKIKKRKIKVSGEKTKFGSKRGRIKDDVFLKQRLQEKLTSVGEKKEANNEALSASENKQTRVAIQWFCL